MSRSVDLFKSASQYLIGGAIAGGRYNPLLKRFSERLYRGLIKNTELELAAGDGERPYPDFLLFGELVEAILEAGSPRDKEKTEGKDRAGEGTGLETFERVFRNHALYRRYDTELVWEEIRSIIKGAKPPLSFREYGSLAQGYLVECTGAENATAIIRRFVLLLCKFPVKS